MLRRILLTALIAGSLAGLFAAALQHVKLIPLIAAAEAYEHAAEHAQTASGDGHHDHAAAAWQPTTGFERTAYTIVADLLAGIGFALMLSAGLALARAAGYPIDAGRGLLWGAAGFAVFALAPAAGLPPELPGMEAAALPARQAWWLLTATATAIGLVLMVFTGRPSFRIAGAIVLALPHLIGPPAAPHAGGAVPAELAASFVAASLSAAALFWLLLGGLSGWLYRRLED